MGSTKQACKPSSVPLRAIAIYLGCGCLALATGDRRLRQLSYLVLPGGVYLAASHCRWCALTAPFHLTKQGPDIRNLTPFPVGGIFLWHFHEVTSLGTSTAAELDFHQGSSPRLSVCFVLYPGSKYNAICSIVKGNSWFRVEHNHRLVAARRVLYSFNFLAVAETLPLLQLSVSSLILAR